MFQMVIKAYMPANILYLHVNTFVCYWVFVMMWVFDRMITWRLPNKEDITLIIRKIDAAMQNEAFEWYDFNRQN